MNNSMKKKAIVIHDFIKTDDDIFCAACGNKKENKWHTTNPNEQTVEEGDKELQCICVDDKDADSVDSGDICPIHTGDWKEEFDSLYEDLELDYPICCNGGIKGDVDCACNGESVRENMKHFITSLLTRTTAEAERKILSQIKLPVRDHSKCPLPQTCIGYQSAESDLDDLLSSLIGERSLK